MSDEHIASAEARLLAAKIDELEKRFGELRRKRDEQHVENKDHLARIDGAINEHAADDRRQLGELREQGFVLSSQMTSLNGNFAELITLLKVGRAVATLGSFVRASILFLAPFAALVGSLYAMWLYLRGKGPWPWP